MPIKVELKTYNHKVMYLVTLRVLANGMLVHQDLKLQFSKGELHLIIHLI